MQRVQYEEGRNEIYVSGNVEYVYGNVTVKKISNGMTRIVATFGKKGAVAVWKKRGYVVWVWNGLRWTKYVDLRYKYGEGWLQYLGQIRMVKGYEV